VITAKGHRFAKIKARSSVKRIECVNLNREGLSNEAIAAKVGISTRQVIRHLNDFLQSEDSRYPCKLTEADVDLMRSELRENLQTTMGKLMRDMSETFDPELRCKLAEAYAKLADRMMRLFGLEPPAAITQNNVNVQHPFFFNRDNFEGMDITFSDEPRALPASDVTVETTAELVPDEPAIEDIRIESPAAEHTRKMSEDKQSWQSQPNCPRPEPDPEPIVEVEPEKFTLAWNEMERQRKKNRFANQVPNVAPVAKNDQVLKRDVDGGMWGRQPL
jgi:hypothetical protein